MNHIRRAALLAFAIPAAAVAVAAQGAPKFAYINSQVILDRAPGRAATEDAFNKEMAVFRTQLDKMEDSLKIMVEGYQKVEATLAANVKEQRQKEIRAKQDELQNRARDLNEQAEKRRYELVQPMMEQIRKVLDDIRQEGGYTMIFDVASGGVVVAADKNLDITDRVISRLKPLPVAAAGSRPDTSKATPGGPRSTPAGITRPKPPSR